MNQFVNTLIWDEMLSYLIGVRNRKLAVEKKYLQLLNWSEELKIGGGKESANPL